MDWVQVGKITKTHGLKGELKYLPHFSGPEFDLGSQRILLKHSELQDTEQEIEWVRGHGKKLIVKFRNCDSIEQAQTLAGSALYLNAGDLPPLPQGEYYWFEIEGLEVFDEDGNHFGRVTEIFSTGSNDVYVVRDGNKELLLPMIEDVVKSIDLKKGTLVFHAVDGLFQDSPL